MKYSVEQIRTFCEQVWEKAGLSHEDAVSCVAVLLAADMRGQRTHGTTHMKDYCDRLLNGTVSNGSDIDIQQTSATTLVVDAKHSVGMVAGVKVMEKCIEQARISPSAPIVEKPRNCNGYGVFCFSLNTLLTHHSLVRRGIALCSTLSSPPGSGIQHLKLQASFGHFRNKLYPRIVRTSSFRHIGHRPSVGGS